MGKLGRLSEEELRQWKARIGYPSVVTRLFKYTGTARFFVDGDTLGAVFNRWHPITWFLFVFIGLPYCAFNRDASLLEFIPVRLSDHWRSKKHEIQWI